MGEVFGSTMNAVAMLMSLGVLVLGALLSFFALAATAAARKAASDARVAAWAASQNQKDSERLLTELQRQVASVRDEAVRLVALRREGGPSTAPNAPTPRMNGPQAEATLAIPRVTDSAASPVPAVKREDAGESTMLLSTLDLPVRPQDSFLGMAMLRMTAGAEPGREYPIPSDTATIGRAPSNAVVLAEEKASRTHAEIRYENNRFILKDNGSTNGTLRNGEPITEVALEFGDVITIGKTELQFTCEGHDLKHDDPDKAILAFQRLLEQRPDFVPALHSLAFLCERDVARRHDAEAIYARLKTLES